MIRRPPSSPLFPYTPLFRSLVEHGLALGDARSPGGFVPRLRRPADPLSMADVARLLEELRTVLWHRDRKSTRLNSSHLVISYAVFCLKKKKNTTSLCYHN